MTKPVTLCFLLFLFAAVTVTQTPSKAQVMFLGVYHFANPNQDVVKSNFRE